jgi:hypothetical protein
MRLITTPSAPRAIVHPVPDGAAKENPSYSILPVGAGSVGGP